MPTLVDLDSFQHQVLRVAGLAVNWYTVSAGEGSTSPCHDGVRIVFDETQPRTADHACSLKVTHSSTTGQATQLRRTIAGGAISVVSFYVRIPTAPTSSSIALFIFGAPTNANIGVTTSGFIRARIGAGAWTDHNVNICDGNWHRIDAKYDRTTTSGTLDVQVDGSALTQVTGLVNTGNATDWNFGFTSIEAATYDAWYSDLVFSNTAGDYPIGDHICKKLEINGSGTDSQGAGAFTDQAGGTSQAAMLAAVDDAWDGTTPNLTQTGEDYTQQTANDGAGYVEFTLADPAESTIWDVELSALLASEDATTADNGEVRLVHSGTTYATTGLVDPSSSATAYNGYRVVNSSRPGGAWDGTKLGAALIRFGFSTDAAPDVAFNSAIVEYAAPWSPAAPASLVTPSRSRNNVLLRR